MITSIFSKSKPINFLVVFIITLLAFLLAVVKYGTFEFSPTALSKIAGAFVLVYGSILLLNFIAVKNSLTKKNNYEILLFSLFLWLIPQSVLNIKTIAANVFVMLALRRLISLKSNVEVKKKLFDAGFWIGIAALCYFWSILFFIVVLLALIFFTENQIKHWIIPFAGFAVVFLMYLSVVLLFAGTFDFLQYVNYTTSFNFVAYNNIDYIVGVTMLLSFGVWASLYYLKNIKSKMKTLKPGFKIVLSSYLVALVIIVISPLKNGGEFVFLFAPLAVIITNYIETIKEKWFKEVFLLTFVLVPLLLLVL